MSHAAGPGGFGCRPRLAAWRRALQLPQASRGAHQAARSGRPAGRRTPGPRPLLALRAWPPPRGGTPVERFRFRRRGRRRWERPLRAQGRRALLGVFDQGHSSEWGAFPGFLTSAGGNRTASENHCCRRLDEVLLAFPPLPRAWCVGRLHPGPAAWLGLWNRRSVENLPLNNP